MPEITILTGKKDEGKTSLIRRLIAALQADGKSIGGVLSPGVYKNGKKIAIEVENLRNEERKTLATYSPGWDVEAPLREWRFIDEALTWGNEVIMNEATPCEVLIIDEIGYLELEKNQGWIAIYDTIRQGEFDQAYVVVRESLLEPAAARWPDARIIHLSAINDQKMFIQGELTRNQPKSSIKRAIP